MSEWGGWMNGRLRRAVETRQGPLDGAPLPSPVAHWHGIVNGL